MPWGQHPHRALDSSHSGLVSLCSEPWFVLLCIANDSRQAFLLTNRPRYPVWCQVLAGAMRHVAPESARLGSAKDLLALIAAVREVPEWGMGGSSTGGGSLKREHRGGRMRAYRGLDKASWAASAEGMQSWCVACHALCRQHACIMHLHHTRVSSAARAPNGPAPLGPWGVSLLVALGGIGPGLQLRLRGAATK